MKKFFFLIITLAPFIATAQNVGISNTAITPDASSMLEVRSDSKGILIPRMTSAQREAISNPANGLLVYQTDGVQGFYYNEGSAAVPNWQPLKSTSSNTSIAASQRWDLAPLSYLQLAMPQTMPALAFDGQNIWAILSVNNNNNIARIGAGSGSPVNYFSINGTLQMIMFDGTYIITSNASKIFQVNPAIGSTVNNVSLTGGAIAAAFDGYRYWVVTAGGSVLLYDDQLQRITANTGLSGVKDILFDGKNMWVAIDNGGRGFVSKIDTSTLSRVAISGQAGNAPKHIAFDGQEIWMTTLASSSVYRFSTADASQLSAVSLSPGLTEGNRLQYDGTNMWISGTNNAGHGVLYKINVNNLGATSVSISGSAAIDGLAFDGLSMWVSSEDVDLNGFLNKVEK